MVPQVNSGAQEYLLVKRPDIIRVTKFLLPESEYSHWIYCFDCDKIYAGAKQFWDNHLNIKHRYDTITERTTSYPFVFFDADLLINVLGEDHRLESKQVEIALKLLNVENIPNVIFYSFVSLADGKMSTRKGRVVYLDDLIHESIEQAYEEVKKRRGDELSEDKMREIAEKIGLGALRYNIIKVQPEKGIVFKWEEALNFEGNSAPFIQYAHARACSILSKSEEKVNTVDGRLLKHSSEINLLKRLAEFPIIIEEACKGFKPHIIATYLFDIASQFNQFYRDCPVLPEKNDELRAARLGLVDATKIVIRNGLNLLGIIAPEEM